jgi:hypothetical protein
VLSIPDYGILAKRNYSMEPWAVPAGNCAVFSNDALRSIRDGQVSAFDAETGVAVVQRIDAARRSAELEQTLRIF